ncbi:MAG: HD domain-containing protein [Chloroflexota bacterium]|nr:HD domain-containing protein [Chloroflexota bacterium]
MGYLKERWLAIESYVLARDPKMVELWERVVTLAHEAHAGQVRNNGQPYLIHILDVGEVLVSWEVEPIIVLGGILHDVVRFGHVESLNAARQRIRQEELAALLHVVHRIAQHDSIVSYVRDNSRLQKIFDLMVEDVRAVLIRCANRLANLRHLDAFTSEQRHLLLLSSTEVYLPLLERIGMWQVRMEMEDHLFKLREPEQYAAVQRWREQALLDRADDIKEWKQIVGAALTEHGVEHAGVELLPRQVASIQRQHLHATPQDVSDLSQLDARHLFITYILTDSVAAAYLALGAVHTCGTPGTASFRDYFAQPKANGYAALHTNVIRNSEPHRVSLRTRRLHDLAQRGILIRAAYDYWRKGSRPTDWQPTELRALEHFIESLRRRQKEHLLILTPRGDVIELPEGATVLDFAYEIHTDIGRQTGAAFVNGVEVALNVELHSGDVVEIRKDLGREWPDPEWLDWVRTSKARESIQAQLRRQPEQKGRRRIDKILRKRGRKLDDLEGRLGMLASEMGSTAEELFISVARGNLRAKDIADQLLLPLPSQRKTFRQVEVEPTAETASCFPGWHPDMILPVECCSPQPNTPIAGYHTERGVELHEAECPSLVDRARVVGLRWKSGQVKARHVDFTLRATNRKGLIHDLTQVILRANVDIVHFEGKRSGAMDEVSFRLEVANELELGYLINTIRAVPNVNRVLVDGRESDTAMVDLSPFLTPPQPIISPFSPGRPVSGDGRFWGRAQEMQAIEGYLRGEYAPSLLVKGPRRIGKTSLLQQLSHSRLLRDHYRFAFVDLQSVAQSDAADVLRLIAYRLRRALDSERRVSLPAIQAFQAEPLETFMEYIGQLTDAHRYAHRKVLLALDEFGTLVESVRNGRLDFQIFHMLRSVMQHNPLFTILLCTSDDVAEMLREDGVLELLNVTQKVRLHHLDVESAQRLIQEPLRGQVYFEPDAISALLRVTDCHPYYLQILGSNLISQLNQDQRRNVYESDIEAVVKRHSHLNGSEFLHLWERESVVQHQVLQALCRAPAASAIAPIAPESVRRTLDDAGIEMSFEEITSTLERLARLETVRRVERPDGSICYHVRIELFRRWFALHYPLW